MSPMIHEKCLSCISWKINSTGLKQPMPNLLLGFTFFFFTNYEKQMLCTELKNRQTKKYSYGHRSASFIKKEPFSKALNLKRSARRNIKQPRHAYRKEPSNQMNHIWAELSTKTKLRLKRDHRKT